MKYIFHVQLLIFGLFIISNSLAQTRPSQQYGLRFQDAQIAYVPLSNSIKHSINSISFSFWMYLDFNTTGNIFGNENPNGYEAFYNDSDGRLYFSKKVNSVETRISTVFDDYMQKWVHLSLCDDNGTLKIYLDGVESASGSVSKQAIDLNPFALGAIVTTEGGPGGYGIWAVISDFSIWSKVLSSTEIGQIATSGISGTETGLTAYWRLNDAVGDKAQDSGPNNINLELGRSNENSNSFWVPLIFTSSELYFSLELLEDNTCLAFGGLIDYDQDNDLDLIMQNTECNSSAGALVCYRNDNNSFVYAASGI